MNKTPQPHYLTMSYVVPTPGNKELLRFQAVKDIFMYVYYIYEKRLPVLTETSTVNTNKIQYFLN